MSNSVVDKIISGGQTGVDRAALDVAIALDIEHGGWCPKGRIALDGCIPCQYRLKQTPSTDYMQRTKWNVRDSNATLILCLNTKLSGGTRYTLQCIKSYQKEYMIIDLNQENEHVDAWLRTNSIINIAGPRENKAPGIYQTAYDYLFATLSNI
jgi:Circularly permutated YpsA SLOG family